MRRRQITIEGGRYLIFYSFEDEPGLAAASPDGPRDDARDQGDDAARDDQPARGPARAFVIEPSAEDERSV
jgi:hypothetical protein